MKRIFTGYMEFTKNITNRVLSHLMEGIQVRGGEILSFTIAPCNVRASSSERIVIIYEDKGNYDEIMTFLEGKDDYMEWVKIFNKK